MTITLLLEQVFNGIQSGVTLFLVAAGLTLIWELWTGLSGPWRAGDDWCIRCHRIYPADRQFYLGIFLAIPLTFASGYLLEYLIIRHLYKRDHMEQVLATLD